ncbi:uncharacterized protein LOC100835838 [Brachypodium distachyon]|uniref:DUF3143 domain-containing protein n=1 Tax=Brachypodium distachyon TaxID=15368 RepID=I1HG85_BRADI|nr:uncharacterized protein LOC100835838 [Brachypodium distachyon]KQK04789.1 hypothetical protein BRADI_2g15950v3 [Brachypodium distachyon]|eukprot:XP_003567857.1 uncharacterized protein LOC100835838 [Brachypodium distachyon]
MSMALPSSLRALAPPVLLLSSPTARLRPGASRAARDLLPLPRRRRGAGLVARAAGAAALPSDAEWLARLPEKKKPLYTHSLPCIEAWLRSIGFAQSREDRAVWVAEMPLWHARLSLDVTDLHIRYLKSGPGNLEKDMERRFSYALSREDIENAILGGP